MAVAARALTLHIPPHTPCPHMGEAGVSATATQAACSATVWLMTVSWPASQQALLQ